MKLLIDFILILFGWVGMVRTDDVTTLFILAVLTIRIPLHWAEEDNLYRSL